jgi:hypothetical protein
MGRLGNRMLQLMGLGVIAQQLRLFLSPDEIYLGHGRGNYSAQEQTPHGIALGSFLNTFYINPQLFEGEMLLSPIIELTDTIIKDSAFNLNNLSRGNIRCKDMYCQVPNFIAKYYYQLQNVLLLKNPPTKIIPGVFIHCRDADINPPRTGTLEYFIHCIEILQPSQGVISCADPSSPIVKELVNRYKFDILDTENHRLRAPQSLARGCSYENLILDAGSYSFLIGLMNKDAHKRFIYWPDTSGVWSGELAHHLTPDRGIKGWEMLTPTPHGEFVDIRHQTGN